MTTWRLTLFGLAALLALILWAAPIVPAVALAGFAVALVLSFPDHQFAQAGALVTALPGLVQNLERLLSPQGHAETKKPRLRGERARCLRISRLACYGPGPIGVQTGACIVRQAQERPGPDYIRPDTVPSRRGGDARRPRSPHTMSAGSTSYGDRNAIRKRCENAPGAACLS